MTLLLAVGFAALLAGSLAVALFVALVRPARAAPSRPAREDPHKASREEDRRRQQRMLAELTDRLAPVPLGAGTWTPRGVNPVSQRCVLEFARWNAPGPDGKPRRRRRSPEAPFEGPIWPFILAVDLQGLPAEEAARAAEAVAGAVASTEGTRARLVTGRSGLREAVVGAIAAAEPGYVEAEGHVDLGVAG